MNKTYGIVIALLVTLSGLIGYSVLNQKNPTNVSVIPTTQSDQARTIIETQNQQVSTERIAYELPSSPNPSLSLSSKDIIMNGKIILSVDDEVIFGFFKDPETGFCNDSNINNTPTRKSFCNSKESFKSKSSFKKIVSSPTNGAIGFVIETDELTPDSLVGIYFPNNTTYKVHLLTNYYLGNDFISFSPSGLRFVYKNGCFEGVCGFTIKETSTLKNIRHFGNSETEPSNIFVRWISDSSIEYKVGSDLKNATF